MTNGSELFKNKSDPFLCPFLCPTAIEEPQSTAESGTLAQESDAYSNSTVENTGTDQIGTAEADQTQMIDLAQAAQDYMTASAQADKARAVNGDAQAANTQQQYCQSALENEPLIGTSIPSRC